MEMVSVHLYILIPGRYSLLFILPGVSGLICMHQVYHRHLTSDQCPRPIGVIAGTIIFFFLNLNPHQGMTLQQHMSQFDFPGLALLMAGVVCILIGLNNGETSCAFGLCDFIY